jgi:hypothetical protein
MTDFWTRMILEFTFIVGSIVFLYSLFLLWGRRSYKNANKKK